MDNPHLPVLDHGYVELDEVMGSDQDIARIARVSTGKGNKTPEADQAFIDYLWRHGHHTPFEMPVVRFKIKAPIFVARQLFRHRTSSINEYSGRYSEMPKEMYWPDIDRIQMQGTDNRQGSGAPLDTETAGEVKSVMGIAQMAALSDYEGHLGKGVSKELARINLPLSQYTVFYWQQNLRNFLHMVALRTDEHAQEEIREYAAAMYYLTSDSFPWTFDAFDRWTLSSTTFSLDEMSLILDLLEEVPELKTKLAMATTTWRKSQQRELYQKLGRVTHG